MERARTQLIFIIIYFRQRQSAADKQIYAAASSINWNMYIYVLELFGFHVESEHGKHPGFLQIDFRTPPPPTHQTLQPILYHFRYILLPDV